MKSNLSVFTKKGNWYKGNTHTHTNAFDGFSPVEDVVKLYKDANYDFLTITDHNLFKVYEEFNSENFLMLNATELTYGVEIDDLDLLEQLNTKVKNGELSQEEMLQDVQQFTIKDINPSRVPHVIAIARDKDMKEWNNISSKKFVEIQAMIDLANEKNCLSIIAHPCWSKLNLKDLEPLKDFTAIEVYNHVCEEIFAGGNSSEIWDQMLNAGMKVNAIACDDTHDISVSLGGYIMVKSEKLDYESIIEAIENGDYYSTMGPEIKNVTVENGVINVECSKVKKVRFTPDIILGRTYTDVEGNMESCSHKLYGFEKHIRIEIEDMNGNKAWTNPIYL